jgi:basic membrane protein A
MGDFVPETNVISDGFFHESERRSAPYFDLFIDGITNIDA